MSSDILWSFQTFYFGQHGRSLDKEGTAALFKSMQEWDKDACLVPKCILQYFIRQCQNGEHGRKDVPLDLILLVACHHFWIEDILIFARSSYEVMRLFGKVVYCLGDRCLTLNAQNASRATTFLHYFDRSRSQGESKSESEVRTPKKQLCLGREPAEMLEIMNTL